MPGQIPRSMPIGRFPGRKTSEARLILRVCTLEKEKNRSAHFQLFILLIIYYYLFNVDICYI